ncbi:Nephrocystin-1, partial [Cladochytrium tenue]
RLPDTIISYLSAVHVLAMYRQVLAETLARDARFGAYHDPVLALFPTIAMQNDLLQLLAGLWDRRLKALSSKALRSPEVLKKKFQDCILIVWPVAAGLADFPAYVEGHESLRM